MTKLDGKTPDLAAENIEQLRQIFPDVFEEGKIDFDKLKQVLGEYVDDEKERYNFTWNGKGKALRLAQTPTTGTLRPCPEEKESKNWDDTQNLYIEGDNLEVLKLLQKSYHGKIKMIYIDPPYNTGNDFVYPDDFSDNIRNYKRITGQVDGDGKPLSPNTEANGRYHTDWLNMMYPRLRLSRNLLSDDGVVFISIDNNELEHIKVICNQIYGENNFISVLAVENNPKGRKNNAFVAESFEYCLVYAKKKTHIYQSMQAKFQKKFFVGMQGDTDKRQVFVDEYGEFRQSKRQVSGCNKSNALCKDSKAERCFTIYYKSSPEQMVLLDEYDSVSDSWMISAEGQQLIDNGFIRYCCTNSATSKPSIPLYSKETLNKLFCERSLLFKDDGTIYEKDRDNEQQITSLLTNKKFGLDLMTESATSKMEELFGVKGIFSNSKSVDFIMALTKLYPSTNTMVLDFFSGASTTAHAVMQLNAEDGGNRKFIMVQLPEPCVEGTEAAKAGYENICEIGKERIRRAGEKIKAEIEEYNAQLKLGEQPKKVPDIGFKVFKLDSSNLKQWQPDYENLEATFFDSINNYVEGRSELDVVYEIILKMGMELTWPLETHTIGGKNVYEIGMGALMICLDDHITTEVAEGMAALYKELAPETWRVVFKDNGFTDDSAKVNIKEILKTAGLEEDAFTTV